MRREWWDRVITSAYQMGISNAEFWAMTPYEYCLAVDAHKRRRDELMDMLAWHGALTVNVHIPKHQRVTPSELLGKSRKVNANLFQSAESFKRHLAGGKNGG